MLRDSIVEKQSKPIGVWATIFRNRLSDGKIQVVRRLGINGVRGSEWYVKMKFWVGFWAEKLGFTDVKVVMKEVIPDWVKAKINSLYQRCRGLLRYIKVLKQKYLYLKVKLAGIEKQEVEWSNFMLPECSVEVKEIKKVEEGWQ